jgi:hypothetical protein
MKHTEVQGYEKLKAVCVCGCHFFHLQSLCHSQTCQYCAMLAQSMEIHSLCGPQGPLREPREEFAIFSGKQTMVTNCGNFMLCIRLAST